MKRISGFILLVPVIIAGYRFALADDHDYALRLLKQNEILSLAEILNRADEQFAGKILEVELEKERGRFIYELEILDSEGVVKEMIFDARTGRLISIKED